ncbi:MAG: hypothetical protein NTV30_00240 [Chloroflexi bacterium]|nr:hypothetical protein [Chloroflexota bacterium]
MRREILDRDVFDSLRPDAISNYLRVNGWSEIRRVDGELTILGKANREGKNQLIWMPVSEQFSDYVPMVSRLIKTVADTEDKSEQQIMDDLQTVAIGDVIRVRTFNPLDIHDHTIPLADGVSLLRRSRMITMAAASSTVKKLPVHPRQPASEVNQFVRNLRLGQSERGSYMIRLIAPITEVPETGELNGIPEKIPFTRRVIMELVKSLNALKYVAEDNRDRGRFLFNTFREAVPSGVSANLCEALIDVEEKEAFVNPIEVSVTWSYVLKFPEHLPTVPIHFDSSVFPYLRQAAKEFRAKNPEIVTVKGWIHTLEKESRSGPGNIRIIGVASGKHRSVRVHLDSETYNMAIDAHKKDELVSVTGTLVADGALYKLENPTNFITEQLKLPNLMDDE